ncbi:C2H2 transcription factor [Metarhizium album ARSEF 1941]|uniref:C2H2 transcription factor n=1 Tax=Metarhizium album (strain ARSEF 1941) TaxID=1081103 RepID=A0A0B2WVS2_METAS|nr:C2H2 transcription factor [Metarhizium album ARSEF 1941]KHN98158.1 C2H2 transcription factor [Metarhizium album ARSEF 1941]
MQPLYGSHPHTPRTPGTPNTPNSATNVPPYQQTSQPTQRPGVYSMAQNPYPPNQGYGTSAPMMPQTTTAASHPQPIAPAPAAGRAPPVLRPMPPGGIMAQPGVSSPYGPGSLMQPNPVMHEGEQPTHVVGSQGRRGILPSAPGRPTALTAGTGAKSNVIPVKDADGKFPCPHCTKTYLHAKHLKRHLLRHTGDRPYMCVLCRDTFSRSDILKRHFQKCSIRRGNPTGASHLSHPQAHVKKNAQAQKAAGLGAEGDLNHINGLNNMPADGMVHPFGMVPVSDGMNNMAGDQSHLSRSSSANQDRNNMAPSMGAPQPYGANVSNSMNNQQMPSYSMPPGQNGMPMYGGSNGNQQSGLDWSQMFQAGAHQSLNNNIFHPPNRGQTQIAPKTGPNHDSGATDCSSSDPVRYSMWGIPTNIQTPYSQLSNQILNFLYPPNEAIDPTLTGMNLYFSPDNTKDFVDQYTHFHEHVPILHPATFRVMEAHPGLAACMCCIGACYSNRVVLSDVQEMMRALWTAMERDCRTLSPETLHDTDLAEVNKSSIEELQAVLLTSVLHFGSGTSQQRHRALKISPLIAAQARRLGLLGVSGDPSVYSALHHPQVDDDLYHLNADEFDWLAWTEQERRVRLMHAIFAQDAFLALFFNIPAQFDPAEVHLPLPCDDAAWTASGAADCASALGLSGEELAQKVNSHGNRRAAQPELRLARQVLLDSGWQIKSGCTNHLGKTVLGTIMIATIRLSQKVGSLNYPRTGDVPPSLGWIVPYEGSSQSKNSTASDEVHHDMDPGTFAVLFSALDKLQKIWDDDLSVQEAARQTSTTVSHQGTLLLSIARHILRNPSFASLEAENEDQYVASYKALKRISAFLSAKQADPEKSDVVQEATTPGEKEYILNLARIFRPLPVP